MTLLRITLLFISFTFMNTLDSQDTGPGVGINTEEPQQILHVNGKLMIGTDDFKDTEGSIRFNPATQDFEGYNGKWHSFTQGNIPSNAVMVFSSLDYIPTNSTNCVTAIFKNYANTTVINGTVPMGKFLLITNITITPRSTLDFDTQDPMYILQINYGSSNQQLTGRYTGGVLYEQGGGYAPIAVIGPGDSVTICNTLLGSGIPKFDFGVSARITGFVVDDLDFNH